MPSVKGLVLPWWKWNPWLDLHCAVLLDKSLNLLDSFFCHDVLEPAHLSIISPAMVSLDAKDGFDNIEHVLCFNKAQMLCSKCTCLLHFVSPSHSSSDGNVISSDLGWVFFIHDNHKVDIIYIEVN